MTFPVCFLGGQAVAGALLHSSLEISEKAARAVASVVGGLAGSGVHTGFHVVQCEIEGRGLETFGLLLAGVGGFFEGSSAAYLAAKLVVKKINPNYNSMGKPLGRIIHSKYLHITNSNAIFLKFRSNQQGWCQSELLQGFREFHGR